MSLQLVMSKQNRDGGWPYVRGSSWTEPTVYAILALLASGELDAARRGMDWLRASQLHDGATYRLRMWLLGASQLPDQEFPGWPWISGTAAWVGPTSLAILALQKEMRRRPSPAIWRRVDQGHRFLLRRMCQGGGWNHGSVRALGYESIPYPETTGMALAALRGVPASETQHALDVATRFLAECRSADALNWLRIGLMAHGRLPDGYCPPVRLACRTLPETSLDILVAGTQRGNGIFWA